MKTVFVLATALSLAGSVRATLIPLSGSASVSATGGISIMPSHGGGGDSFHDAQSASVPFSAFHGSVSDSVAMTVQPQPGWTYFLPLDYKAASQSRQDALVTGNGITISGSLWAGTWSHAQVGSLGSHAASAFDVTFRLDEAMSFDLALHANVFQSDDPYTPVQAPLFSLSALDGSFSLDGSGMRVGRNTWGYNGSGLLPAGDYRMIYTVGASAAGDPLGESGSADFGLKFNVAAVPEIGSSGVLLSLGLAGTGCAWWLRRKRGAVGGQR